MRVYQMFSKLHFEKYYIDWTLREKGNTLSATVKGVLIYMYRIAEAQVSLAIFQFDFFQSALLFAMSSIPFSRFFDNSIVSTLQNACNTAAGFEFMDASLFNYALVTVSFLLVPAVYEISKVMVPGIPSQFIKDKSMPPEFITLADEKKKRYGVMRKFKYLSFFSPDLWWAYSADSHLNNLTEKVPLGTKYDAPTLRSVQEQIRANEFERGGFLESRFDSGAPKQPYLDAVMAPSLPHFRVWIESKWSGAKSGKGTEKRKLFVQKCHGILVNDMIWDTVLELPIQTKNAAEKFVIVRISRVTAKILDKQSYYANEETNKEVLSMLNKASASEIVIFVGLNFKSRLQKDSSMYMALERIGASDVIADTSLPPAFSYLVIGIPDMDKELIKDRVFDQLDSIDVCFYLRSYFSQTDSNLPYVLLEKWQEEPSILLHTLQIRTEEENWQWAIRCLFRNPSYFELCKKEYTALLGEEESYLWKMASALQVLLHIGHFRTKVGRFAIKLTGWKFVMFTLACLGIWDDSLVSLYNVHGHVFEQTVAFDQPHSRKHIVRRAKDDRELGDEFIEEVGGRIPASKAEYERQKISANTLDVVNAEEIKRLERELRGLDKSKSYSTERMLMEDYASVLYSLVAPRSTFFQMIPYFGGIFTIYASETARSPVFVFSEGLLTFLPDFYPNKNAWGEARETLQTELDDLYHLKISEVYEGASFVSTKQKIDRKTGVSQEISENELLQRHEINDALRADTVSLLQEKPLKIPEWFVAIKGLSFFFGDSRLLCYMLNVFLFIIEVLVVFVSGENQSTVIVASLIVIIPVAALQALDLVMSSGYVCSVRPTLLFSYFIILLFYYFYYYVTFSINLLLNCFSRFMFD